MKTIGIVGTRSRDNSRAMKKVKNAFFKVYEEGDRICSGGCPKGGDRFAEVFHKNFSIPILIFPANWTKFGKGAGFVRNTDIARESDILIACVSKSRTGGTEDTIEKFLKDHSKDALVLVE